MKIRVKTTTVRNRRRGRSSPFHWMAVGTLATYATIGSSRWAIAKGSEAETAGPDGAPQTQQPVRRFDIPAGPLARSLESFRATAGFQVEAPAEILKGIGSPGVSGVFTAEQALAQILAGTAITYRLTGPDSATLELRRRSETVEVTARVTIAPASPKYTEPLRDIPQTITVIPRSVIQDQNAITLRDVLRNVPGITIQAGEGGVPAGDNLTIRGFSARTDIFIDGVRDFGGYSRDPYNLEQVEVTKGPASSFAGRGSTGGSVNLVTKTPQGARDRSLSLGGGSDAYKRATVDLNEPIQGMGVPGAAFRLNAMFTDTDVARRDVVENKRWAVSPSLAAGLGTKTRFTLLYSHLDQDNVPDYGLPWVPAGTTGPLASYAGGRPPVEPSLFYGLTTRDYEKTKTDVTTATFERDFSPKLTARNQLRYGHNDRDSVITAPRFVNASSPTEFGLIDRGLRSRDQTDQVVSNQTSLTARFDTGRASHALVSGVELVRERSENFARLGPNPPQTDLFAPNPADPYAGPITRTGAVTDGEARTTALYAFDTVHLGPRFELTGGLRYDHFDVQYDSKATTGVVTPFERTDELFSWRAGAIYKPRPNGSIYLGVGTSFNPSAEGLSLAATNVNLDPEKTRSYELGSKWDLFANRLSLTGALFRTEKTNARTPGVNPGDPPQVLLGEQRVDGVELGVYATASRVTMFAGYAYMRSEIEASNTADEAGNALAQTPENTFNLWLTYRLRGDLTLGGGVQFMDSVYRNAVNTLQAPSYWLLNATAAYPVNQKLTLRLNAYNLANEDYVDRVGGGHFIPGPGRYGMLSLDLKF